MIPVIQSNTRSGIQTVHLGHTDMSARDPIISIPTSKNRVARIPDPKFSPILTREDCHMIDQKIFTLTGKSQLFPHCYPDSRQYERFAGPQFRQYSSTAIRDRERSSGSRPHTLYAGSAGLQRAPAFNSSRHANPKSFCILHCRIRVVPTPSPAENLSRRTRFDRSVIGRCRPIEIVISRSKKTVSFPEITADIITAILSLLTRAAERSFLINGANLPAESGRSTYTISAKSPVTVHRFITTTTVHNIHNLFIFLFGIITLPGQSFTQHIAQSGR